MTNSDDDTTPVAVADAYMANSDPLSVPAPGVVQNDTDMDGDAIIAILESGPITGSLSLNLDGSFVYTPTTSFNGMDVFSYRASDGTNNSQPVEVEIVVDQVDPTVDWVSPVGTGQTIFVTNEILVLSATASDNLAVDRVRFRRWDAVNMHYVELGEVFNPPYSVTLDTSTLNYAFNQINVDAYDTAGNLSERKFIWLYREAKLYLPMVIR